MSEERIEVLKLVADKVIGVDEAERLLRALDDGERARSESRRGSRVEGETRRVGAVAGAFGGMGEALGAIGELVESTVTDAMEGVERELRWDDDDVGEVLPAEAFAIPAGGRLTIRQRGRSGGGPTLLTLLPAEGDQCTVEGADPEADVRARREGGTTRVRWRGGPLTVRVPATVGEVEARVMGGDLVAFGLGCPIEARTMGGRVELGASAPFDLRTAGGDLVLRLAPGLGGRSRLSSMGGSVSIIPADGVAARIEAICTGGDLQVEPGLGRVRREGHRLHRRTVVELGPEGQPLAEITVKSVGGDVTVKRELV